MSSIEGVGRRKHLLIDGRRVRLSDLLDTGLLVPEQELRLERPRYGEVHLASVTHTGTIRLDDGQEFGTPSGAAMAVTGVATDGWNSWRTSPQGRYLSTLRQELMQTVAADEELDALSPEAELVAARAKELAAARKQAEAGSPVEMSVRELLRKWNLNERDRAYNIQIEADLANHGLHTEPDFRAVNLEASVKLVTAPDLEVEDNPTSELPRVSAVQRSETVLEESEDIGLTLGNLLSEERPLAFVDPSATLEQVITMLWLNDYSQVAVLRNAYDLRGAVSWKSIASARHRNAEASLGAAIMQATPFDYDTRLLTVLDVLQREEFIFVRSYDGRIAGIVTAADVVRTYDETATPFFLLGEIDQELRRVIQERFELDSLQHLFQAEVSSFDRMAMGHYQAVLGNPACWTELNWPLDRKMFGARLDEIRKIRNRVMHFNPDPVSSVDVSKAKIFLDLIRTFGH